MSLTGTPRSSLDDGDDKVQVNGQGQGDQDKEEDGENGKQHVVDVQVFFLLL